MQLLMRQELERRQSNTEKVLALLRGRPKQWISWSEFADLVGDRAYRTRISNAKKIITREQGTIESRTYHSGQRIITEYRYLPYVPIGRDAGEQIERIVQGSFF